MPRIVRVLAALPDAELAALLTRRRGSLVQRVRCWPLRVRAWLVSWTRAGELRCGCHWQAPYGLVISADCARHD